MVEALDGRGPGNSASSGLLLQEDAVDGITARFGDEFIYVNENGNPAISRHVLNEFRRLRGDGGEWDKYDKCWTRVTR
jgi:hypothetical protein